ncbi:MAG: SAM-dependent chlorinase/fluorinase, partial [Thermoplasmatales archaeon]|nr:SAM-dependent chlorinase/fluorinase [Thermoplasmatales archaeon]
GTSLNQVLNFDNKIMVFIGDKQVKLPFVITYDNVKKNEILAIIGSSNLLEIAQNQGNAAKKLGIKADDDIKILLP